MARLTDLLEWLAAGEPALLASVWVLLDIKTDDDPEVLLPAVARAIASVPLPEGGKGWRERVVVGCWNVRPPFYLFFSLFFVIPFPSHVY